MPVIYHDFLVSESGYNMAVSSFYSIEFTKLKSDTPRRQAKRQAIKDKKENENHSNINEKDFFYMQKQQTDPNLFVISGYSKADSHKMKQVLEESLNIIEDQLIIPVKPVSVCLAFCFCFLFHLSISSREYFVASFRS